MRNWEAFVREHLSLSEFKPEREKKIIREVAAQLEDFYCEALSRGMTETEADAYARRQIKDWECFASDVRRFDRPHRRPRIEQWEQQTETYAKKNGGGWTMFADLTKDISYGMRMLRKNPGFTAVAVLTLALGIGANTAIFAFLNAALIKPLPYPDPERLVFVWETNKDGDFRSAAYLYMQEWREESELFSDLASMIAQSVNLTGDDDPTRIRGGFVSDGFFDVVGVRPMMGRGFRKGEDREGSELVAVLNHAIWKVRYGSNPDIVGERIQLNGESYTVIGVMPEDFLFPIDGVEIWMPMHRVTQDLRRAWWNFGRIKQAFTLEQAQSELESTVPALQGKYPEMNEGLGVRLVTLQSFLTRRDRPALLLFMGAVGMVLLIACANVANLLLARGVGRESELAIRLALGANRTRLVRQLLTETVLLAGMGTLLGLVVAQAGVQVLIGAAGGKLNGQTAELDFQVLAFAAVLTLLTSVLFGLAPAIKFSRPDLTSSLKEGSRGRGKTRQGRRLGSALVVAQMALAVMLLVGAGLLLRSFGKLAGVDPGFNTKNLLTLEYRLPRTKYTAKTQIVSLHQQVVERVRTIPGVLSAAHFKRIPFSFNRSYVSFIVEGQPPPPKGKEPRTFMNTVGVGGFRTLGIPVLQGRTFSREDGAGPPVVVISEIFANRHWENDKPVGKRIRFPDWGITATVIGVVGKVKYMGLNEREIPQMYTTVAQDPSHFASLAIRTEGDPMSYVRSVQEAVWSVDKDQPMYKFRTVESLIDRSLSDRRLNMGVLAVFALTALVLAAIGLYGVIAYTVRQRTHEMGIRMALGAQKTQILGLVIRKGMLITTVGLLAGVAGAIASSRLISNVLFGVETTDLATFVSVSFFLLLVSLLACYIPARRATKVDPMVALRYE